MEVIPNYTGNNPIADSIIMKAMNQNNECVVDKIVPKSISKNKPCCNL